jgi:hypothetical protein
LLRWSSGQSAKVELQRLQPEARERTVPEERLVLAELLEQAGDGDFCEPWPRQHKDASG